jgi:TPR repeat protein
MRKASWTLIGLLAILATPSVNGQGGIDPQTLAKAKAGDAIAELSVGTRYFFGKGVAQDFAEAVRWLRMAATQGLAPAEGLLGAAYDRGEGVEKDG